MLIEPKKPADTILGYTLKARLGAGGYGEVWSAEAPGGLLKAVKLIFGFHEENRAQRELKALNRIKQVRHPFLLSLERIDVVDGRLVVVTELAENSLRDVFNAYVQDGLQGIPRGELIAYLADAADSLDYLSNEHQLQHLDIKPENLLIVGRHVKVADFGLVKDIHDATQSLMGGLTPTYAAPELFDGRPNRNSDQYSLAIVFQEMLTGTRPFDGRTAAQLASQHLNATPNLSALPAADQKVLKRALAKSPEVRFASCRDFVDQLKRTKRTRSESTRPKLSPSKSTPVNLNTQAVGISQLDSLAKKSVQEELPPVSFGENAGSIRPTLFVGIGETATTVLRHLRRRFDERLGSRDRTPAYQLLCVDTDANSLKRATRHGVGSSLDHDEILPLPLRSSAEYRNQEGLDVSWISRRWIYNIPRSRQTEGLRPLGRLAFVDHHRAIFEKLDAVIESMTDSAAVHTTAETVNMKPTCQSPQVFIVASVSGGVGSGMVCDMAYAVRTILSEHGFDDGIVNGVLVYSTGRSLARRDVTVANVYACLSELHHFSCDRGYPGDTSCDLPAYERGPTFDNTYLADLGHEPLPEEYEAAAAELGEYLYLDAATKCGTYFEHCRQEDFEPDGPLQVRTIGLSRSGCTNRDALSAPADVAALAVLKQWLTPGLTDDQFDPALLVTKTFDELNLNANAFLTSCAGEIDQRLDQSLATVLSTKLEPLQCELGRILGAEGPEYVAEQVEAIVSSVLKPQANASTGGRFDLRVSEVVEELAVELAQSMASELESLILSALDNVGNRFGNAQRVHQIVEERLQMLEVKLDDRQRSLKAEIENNLQVIGAPQTIEGPPHTTDEEQRRVAITVFSELSRASVHIDLAARLIELIQERTETVARDLLALRSEIDQLAQDFEKQYTSSDRFLSMSSIGHTDVVSESIVHLVVSRIDALIAPLDRAIQLELLNEQSEFQQRFQQRPDDWIETLRSVIDRTARRMVSDLLEASDLDKILQSCVDDDKLGDWMQQTAALAVPHLCTSCGGKSRLVVAVPRQTSINRLQGLVDERIMHPAGFVDATLGDIVFCYEVGGIVLAQVAAMLIQGCPDAINLVDRIHTRTDVDWKPIIRW